MKVAITSTGKTLQNNIDSRFGRCAYFALYDTETKKCDFVANPNKDSDSGTGPASVRFIANKGAEKVVSGEFGFKIKTLMDDLNIQMITVKEEKTIQEIIHLLNH